MSGENKFKHIGALTSSPETFMISPFICISIFNGPISIIASYYRRIKDQLQKSCFDHDFNFCTFDSYILEPEPVWSLSVSP
jgi:hypothetical protein